MSFPLVPLETIFLMGLVGNLSSDSEQVGRILDKPASGGQARMTEIIPKYFLLMNSLMTLGS
jgi:hypothetical protein